MDQTKTSRTIWNQGDCLGTNHLGCLTSASRTNLNSNGIACLSGSWKEAGEKLATGSLVMQQSK